MARTPMMAANWKMNNTISEAVVLAQEISNEYEKDWKDRVDVVVCPPFLDIKPVWTVFDFDKTPYAVGAQNCYWEPSGAYTGEISIKMLKEARAEYCIVGHSERRNLFAETNEDVNRKARALVAEGMHPIICVGESLAVHDAGETNEFVCAQVRAAFAGMDVAEASMCVVAYEPVWAIGTSRTALPEQAEVVCGAIRATAAAMFGDGTAEGMRVLYGGSMKPENANDLIAQPNVDGGLVGGASSNARSFVRLIEACLR